MKGQTALHLAAELGCIAVMRTLLSYGADFTIKVIIILVIGGSIMIF